MIQKGLEKRVVSERKCGCQAHWEWIWEWDNILPTDVRVEIEVCNEHQDKAPTFEQKLYDRLRQRLENLRYEVNLEGDGSEEFRSKDE